jgi:hypothetical protein
MPDCERMSECPYYSGELMKTFPMMLEIRQKRYCRGDYTTCARYMVFKALGKQNVPADLIPSQTERAKEIIEKATGE